jgi:hypothetical protein
MRHHGIYLPVPAQCGVCHSVETLRSHGEVGVGAHRGQMVREMVRAIAG